MIEYCRDFRRVKRVCDYTISISREIFYMMEVVDGKDLGVWMFHPCEDGLSVHVTLNEECRGRDAVVSAGNAFEWIFDHTSVGTIYAVIPPEKRHVRTFVRAIGFEFSGKDDRGSRVYRLERTPNEQRRVA